MAEIPNALTDLLRGKTPEEIYETLYQNHCLSPAGIEQRARAIALIRKADVEAQRHREELMVGPTREYYVVGALMGGGYLNAHAKDLLDTITYKPNRDSSTSSRRRTSALRRCANLLRMVWARIVRLGRDQEQAGGPSAAKAAVTPPRQGDVYLVAPAGRLRSRFAKPSPCVVVSPDQSNALMLEVTVAPLVTGDHASPFRVPLSFQGKRGHVLLGQMETVPVNRLRHHLGVLDPTSLETVLGGLDELFGD